MYNNHDKSEVVYLYDFSQNRYVRKFPTLLDVLKFIASNMHLSFDGKSYDNEYLDNINMGNDKTIWYKNSWVVDSQSRFYSDIQVIDKRYMFVDSLSRIIDVRLYRKEIEILFKKKCFDFVSYPKRRRSKYFMPDVPYQYRKDPVPYKGKLTGCKAYRIPKLHNLYKQITDEDAQYIRAKRNFNNLPNIYWDDCPLRSRYKSRSWKDCTKKRKQWM